MRRIVVFAFIVVAFIALSTIHFSKGEPLQPPPSVLNVTVRPTAK